MLSLSRALAAGAVLAASVQAGDHFIQTQVRTLSITRIDPLVTPGANGPHVHTIVGGSSFGPGSNGQSLLNSKCSSTSIQDDKSAYWSPTLYHNFGNGSYKAIVPSTRIYYFLKDKDGKTPVTAFPQGLRMLAGGYSDTRPTTYPPKGVLSYDQRQAMDPKVNAIMWGCSAGAVQGQGTGGSMDGQSPWLPNHAPNGCGVVNAGVFFPSCNDGRLDSDDHYSHMAYPTDGSNGYICPSTHPNKFPTMFMEHFYFIPTDQPYRGANQDNWVLSNGDTTGLNYHADFINAWVPGSLENILSTCNAPNAPEGDLQSCAAIAKSLSVDAADACRSEGDIVDEDVGLLAPISALPGCNPIWGPDVKDKPACKADQLPMIQPVSRYNIPDFKLGLPLGSGNAKVITAPSGSASPDAYSYTYSSTSSTAVASTSPAATTAAATTATESATPATTAATGTMSVSSDPYGAAPNPASASASGSSTPSTAATVTATGTASADPYYPPGGVSTAEAVAVTETATSPTTAATTATASADPYYPPGVVSSSASGTLVRPSASGSASAAAVATATSSDPYSAYYLPGVVSSSASGTLVTPSASGSASAAAVTASTSSYPYGAYYPPGVASSSAAGAASTSVVYVTPGSSSSAAPAASSGSSDGPAPTSVVYVAPGAASTPASNPPASTPVANAPSPTSTTTAASAVPTPQNAPVVGGGKGSGRPKNTCAHRKHKNKPHGRRREWRKPATI